MQTICGSSITPSSRNLIFFLTTKVKYLVMQRSINFSAIFLPHQDNREIPSTNNGRKKSTKLLVNKYFSLKNYSQPDDTSHHHQAKKFQRKLFLLRTIKKPTIHRLWKTLLLALFSVVAVTAIGPRTTLTSGTIEGVNGDHLKIFRGVPFAQTERWKPAQDVTPWSGVRFTTTNAPSCIQSNPYYYAEPQFTVTLDAIAEDCLYMNVWQSTQGGANQPLLIFIHGGGWTSGSPQWFDGALLAQRLRATVVVPTYRLGVFGNIVHPDAPGSDNLSFRDIQKAIAFIRANAAAFGASASKIYLAGHSAGGWAVLNVLSLTNPSHSVASQYAGIIAIEPALWLGTSEEAVKAAFETKLGALTFAQAQNAQEHSWEEFLGAAQSDGATFTPTVGDNMLFKTQLLYRLNASGTYDNRIPVLVIDAAEPAGSFGALFFATSLRDFTADFCYQSVGLYYITLFMPAAANAVNFYCDITRYKDWGDATQHLVGDPFSRDPVHLASKYITANGNKLWNGIEDHMGDHPADASFANGPDGPGTGTGVHGLGTSWLFGSATAVFPYLLTSFSVVDEWFSARYVSFVDNFIHVQRPTLVPALWPQWVNGVGAGKQTQRLLRSGLDVNVEDSDSKHPGLAYTGVELNRAV